MSIPYKSSTKSPLASLVNNFYGDGENKTSIINKDHIGTFVARIIDDPRTLNQEVFAHEDQVSQKEIYEICSRVAGEDFRAAHPVVSLLSYPFSQLRYEAILDKSREVARLG